MTKLVIIDYGLGNLHSVFNNFRRSGIEASITNEPERISEATHLVLPGVGHYAAGMKHLHESGLVSLLNERVIEAKVPILGICLGMQMFGSHSEEGNVEGLGWIPVQIKRFSFSPTEAEQFKIPHIGWNSIAMQKEIPIFEGIPQNELFYFVHSYYAECQAEENVLTVTEYGKKFHSAFHKENIIGLQFHPEKSHDAGSRILKNFVENYG